MASDLIRAYRVSARTTRRTAKNFYFAFLSLPRAQRWAVYALYAFCREADSLADDAGLAADVGARRAGLQELRARLAAAARGEPSNARDLALADAIARFGIRQADLEDVLTGIEMDFASVPIATVDALRTYCYHVASAVGLATLPVLTNGLPPTGAARAAAADLGLGMQYVNVLRDVGEDLALGRIYLPASELAAHGVREADLFTRAMTDGLRSLLAAHAALAREHLDRGRRLLADLPPRSRGCPWLLAEIYGRILKRIVDAGYPVFERRVGLPAAEKLWLLATARWRSAWTT